MPKVIHLRPILFRTMAAILDYRKKNNGYNPTIRQLQDLLKLQTTSTVSDRLRKLEATGAIERHKRTPRAIKITCDMIVLDIDYEK